MSDLRIDFRPMHLCNHTGIVDKNPFGICYGCGEAMWKCEIDIIKRKNDEINKMNQIYKQTQKINMSKLEQLRTILKAFKEAGLIISPIDSDQEIEVASVLEWAVKIIESVRIN